MFGHVEGRPRPLRRRVGERREVTDDHLPHVVAIDVADDDHRHQIRAIPVVIEAHQLLALRVLDDVGAADRRTVGVT